MVETNLKITQPTRAGEPIELTLDKAGQRLVYRCERGHEAELIKRLADDAADPQTPLTWFDAAVLSHRVGLSMRDVLSDRSQSPSAVSRSAAEPQ